MSERQILKHTDKLNVNFGDVKNCLPKFRTKYDAVLAGSKFGWRNAVRVLDRFESFWVVGSLDFQPSYTAGVKQDTFRFPVLLWDKKDGVEFCPVIKVKRVSK